MNQDNMSSKGKFGFFRKLVNKKLNKLQYKGTNHPYLLSFENTKLDWYTNSSLNLAGLASSKNIDMAFFPDCGQEGNMVMIYVFDIGGSMFNDEALKMLESAEKEGPEIAQVFLLSAFKTLTPKFLEFDKHMRSGGKDFEIEDSKPLDNSNRLGLEVRGILKGSSLRTYDVVFPFDRASKLLVFGSTTSWNPDKLVVEDLKNIARSIQF